jgi:hypothetical protein
LTRRIAVAGPVKASTGATIGAAAVAGGFGTGLSIRLLAIVPPRTVMDANVLIFMLAPRIAFNLTAIRCGPDSGIAAVVEP